MNKQPRTKKILIALVLGIAISTDIADAGIINNDKYILANNTYRSENINTSNHKFLKSKIKGQITGFASTTPTLDSLKPRVETYMNSPVMHELTKIPDGGLSPANAVTLVINGEDYYYIPRTNEDTGFLQLMATYANTLVKETVDASKAIYSYGGKMYTYDTEKLPLSVYRVDNGTSGDYNYVTYTKQTNSQQTQSYYLVKLQPSQMKIEGIDWTQKDNGTGYDWPNYTPASSVPKFTPTTGDLTSVEGAVRFNLPYKSGDTKTQYYKYEYNIPTTYTRQASRVSNQDVNDKYFYNIDGGSSAGSAIWLNSNGYTIKADFINNTTTGAGTIVTTNVTVPKIEGNFIYNTTREGGCMHIQGGHIGEIIGSFVGNSTKGTSGKNNGGALNIWSDAVVDSIHGVFVGNTATNNSGAINNGGQSTASTIKVITGDFIANSALKGNGGAILNEKTTPKTGSKISKIYAITGDYIGNAAKGTADNTGRGGAIYNRGLIYDVIGDYIGNAAEGSTSKSTTGLGGAIYNENSMRYVTGDYVGNSATNDGGAIYNAGNITSVTADFIGNRVSNGKGAGIYNSGTMALVAETKDMLFYDNKDSSKYNDIYQYNGTIDINAAENHNIIFNGTIEGEGDSAIININNGTAQNINGNYEFNNIISGNNVAIFNGAKIKLDKIKQTDNSETYGVFNLSGNTFKNDANGGVIDVQNEHIDAQNLGSVTLNSNLNYKFDMNLATKVTDTIEASYSSSGTRNIILSDINLLGTKSWGDFTPSDIGTKIKILTSNSNSLQLALSEELDSTFETAKVWLGTATETGREYETITPETTWDKNYEVTIYEKKYYGRWNLAQTTTKNDSLGFTSVVRNESRKESMGDTLYLVNKDTTNATKDFTANENGATYTLTTDLDYNSASTKGTLNINGIANGDTETLNLNGHTGFGLADSNSKLNFNNITVGDNTKTPATTTIATVTNGSATVGLNNAILNGNILNGNINSDVNYNLSIAGTTTVNGTLDKSNTTFNGTELQFNTDTFKNATLNVESGTINLYDTAFSTYEIDKLVSNNNARYNINLTFDNGVLKADKFKVGVNSSGTIHLGDLSIDLPTDDFEHIVQIIDASNSYIRLDYTESSVLTEATANMSSDEILAKGFGLYTQNTTNDSIKVRGLQDTFKAWANYATTNDKQFTFVEGADKEIPNSFSFDGNNKATIINNGTVTNNGTLSNLAITNNNTFTNNDSISDISLTNSGTFTNNSNSLSVKSGSNSNTINGTGTLTIAEDGTYTNFGTINNAIINNGTLTSAAEKLGGTIENNSVLNLSGTLAKEISGDNGTTKVNGTLNLKTGASVAGTLDMNNGGTITISGGSTQSVTTHNIGKIVGNGNLNIDMNLSEQTSDKINLAKASSGTLTINSVNIIDPTTTQIDKNFSVKILNPQVESSIQLALSSDVQEQFANHEYISDSEGESITTDEVQATTPWTQDFYEKHITTARTEYSKLGLSDDKQSITITERREVGGVTTDTSLGDTLKVVNKDYTQANKSFKSTDANDVYTVKEDLDVTNGNVTVEGVVDSTGESVVRSTIDFNSKNGFVLDENNASITLKNVEIKNASMLIGGIAENEVEVVLNNVNLHDNGTGIQTGGNVKIEGNSTIADNIKVIGADSEININSNDTVTLNSILTGTGASNKLNISNGTVNLGNSTSITGLNTTFNNTTINLANESSLNGLNTTFNGNNNLNMANNSTKTLALDTVNLNGVLNMQVDADLANKTMDRISATTAAIGAGSRIDVSKINLMSPTTEKQLDLVFTDNSTLAGIVNYTGEGQIVYSPIYKYNTSYIQKDGKGYFSFASAGSSPSDFNPAVMASSVATIVTGYQNQMQALHQGFYHMDRYMKHSDSYRYAAENQNKIASLTPVTNLDVNRVPETSQAMWVIPYTTFERVNLSGGVSVDNISYGMTYGGDSDMFDMGHGFKGVISGFIGYNGNHMNYNNVSMTQNGGFVGATLNAYRGNFFTGLSVSTGASSGEADTMYGHDNITLLTAGVANKTGYNFEFLNGKVIVQPSLFLGYSWVNTFDYTNAAGVRISQDPLNALQIIPGVKVIGNTKSGWQPYAGVDMVWNIFMGRNQATANDVVLPKLSERAYVQYGVGIQKTWADRFTGFLQAMIRNGGRNGIVLSAGFRWTLGKNSKKVKNAESKSKTVIKDLK